jgi:hypothetical protein
MRIADFHIQVYHGPCRLLRRWHALLCYECPMVTAKPASIYWARSHNKGSIFGNDLSRGNWYVLGISFVLSYTNICPVSSSVVVFICARVGHELWQLSVFMIIETALVGSLASIHLDSKIQAIITVICLYSTVTPPQLLTFAMLPLGIDDQTDI